MAFAPVYLIGRLWYRFIDFFHHWYVDGSRAIGHRLFETLAIADRSFAVKVTLRHFFQPLYRDYTVIGRILGVIFRTGRIAIGLIVYALITAFFVVFYLIWIAVPVIVIIYVV